MVAILVASCKEGRSGWVSVGARKRVVISGMGDGDEVILVLADDDGEVNRVHLTVDSDFIIPSGIKRILGEHGKVNSSSRVCIDLR
jgi:hypothetical protein